MALNPTDTATGIVNRIQTLIDNATTGGVFDPQALARTDIWVQTLTQIFDDIKNDIVVEMEIPIGSVLIAATAGVTNTSAISLTHKSTT